MIWIVLGVLVAWVALGPVVLVAVVGALCVPRLRWWVQDRVWIDWRRAGAVVGVLAALTGLVLLVPDGWLPIPPSPGLLVMPGYVGRPAAEQPVAAGAVAQHPHLAPNGVSTRHNDAAGSGTVPWPGPIGLEPEVDTTWFGLEACADLVVDERDRVVATCHDPAGPHMHVIDPGSMRKLATKELPEPGQEDGRCGNTPFYLDADGKAVVATADHRILSIRTADADGEADLTTDEAWDLTGHVADDDCVVAILPDWSGRMWFTTSAGLVGTVAREGGAVRSVDLGEEITASMATDETGGTYVVTTHALHRLSAGPAGRPVVDWRTEYDRGTEQKAGQPNRGSGTPPTIIDGGIVAIADNAEPQLNVAFYERSSGREVCKEPVFEPDESATASALASVGDGVIVQNNHGYGSRVATLLGRATNPGIARVDVAGGSCELVWTSEEIAPSGGAEVSLANGLAYTYTKKPSWWGVSAWYLTALDVTTGRTVFSVRTGTGMWLNNDRASMALAPDGALWVPTVSGLVRVRDRVRD